MSLYSEKDKTFLNECTDIIHNIPLQLGSLLFSAPQSASASSSSSNNNNNKNNVYKHRHTVINIKWKFVLQ